MFKVLRAKLMNLENNTLEVITKSAHSLLVKMLSVALGLVLSIFLGRILGASDFGIINLVNRIVQVLIILGLFGIRQVIIKTVAISYNSNNPSDTANIMYTSYWINGTISILISIVFILICPWLTEQFFEEPRLKWPLIISVMVLTPQVFSRIFSGALVGYRKIWQSNLVDNTLSALITFTVLSFFYFLNYEINIINVSIIYAISRILVMIVVGTYWNFLFTYSKNKKKEFIFSKIYKTTFSLFLVSVTSILFLNTDGIMLGWLGNVKMVGLYTVAAKIATLTIFFMQVTNAAISPKLAHLFADKNINQLEKMIQTINLGLTGIAVVTLFFIIIFGRMLLGLWGQEFEQAYYVLVILSLGQFFNIATGASGAVMMMCGLQHEYAKLSLILVVLNLILNFLFIQYYGILGAAIATSLIIALDNISRAILVKQKLNIWILPFFRLIKKYL